MNYRGRSVLGDEVEKPVDTPIELPQTPLGEVAELLLSAQKDIGAIGMSSPSDIMALVHVANDKLAQARILVDVERGDGQ